MINEITRALNGMSDKVDLKAETIELGLVQDIEAISKSVLSKESSFESAVQKIEKAQSEMSASFVDLEKELSKLDSAYQQLRRNAGVLGIDVPKEAENSYKTALAMMKNTLATYKKFNK